MADVEKLSYTVKEAAEALGYSTDTVYRLVHRADFPTIRVGKSIRISKELLADWVRRQAGGESA